MTRRLTRREIFRLLGLSACASLTEFVAGCGTGGTSSERTQLLPAQSAFVPDAELQLTATPAQVGILPGEPTRVWKYEGVLLSGDASVLQTNPNTYLGPILRVRRGQRIRIHLKNALAEPTITHWHGLHFPQEMDGHPRFAIQPGGTYVYDLEINNRAGTYWFHPHPDRRTGFQVYAGLAGLFLVSDDEEKAANLPAGEYDVPLVIQDRSFNSANELVYITNPMDQMNGVRGDRILVNGKPDFELNVATRAYRLRLLNGSNSRVYKLAWDDGTPLVVIATDGGLLARPVQRNYVSLGPAERVELWADFSKRPVGSQLKLKSIPFSGMVSGMMGMMGGMMGGMMRGMGRGNAALPDGAEFTILNIKVDREAQGNDVLPEHLSSVQRYRLEDAVNSERPRTFGIGMQGMMTFAINGRVFELEGVASDEIVKLDTVEVWDFVNQTGGMAQMAHPMHIHSVQFQVLERQIAPQFEAGWETIRGGYVDEGWKDTVLVWPGERVRLLMRFSDFPGLFLYHCHNLEHEDQGLMRNFRIQEL